MSTIESSSTRCEWRRGCAALRRAEVLRVAAAGAQAPALRAPSAAAGLRWSHPRTVPSDDASRAAPGRWRAAAPADRRAPARTAQSAFAALSISTMYIHICMHSSVCVSVCKSMSVYPQADSQYNRCLIQRSCRCRYYCCYYCCCCYFGCMKPARAARAPSGTVRGRPPQDQRLQRQGLLPRSKCWRTARSNSTSDEVAVPPFNIRCSAVAAGERV